MVRYCQYPMVQPIIIALMKSRPKQVVRVLLCPCMSHVSSCGLLPRALAPGLFFKLGIHPVSGLAHPLHQGLLAQGS